jgi:hypothetical protein
LAVLGFHRELYKLLRYYRVQGLYGFHSEKRLYTLVTEGKVDKGLEQMCKIPSLFLNQTLLILRMFDEAVDHANC